MSDARPPIFDDPYEPQTEAECRKKCEAALKWFNAIPGGVEVTMSKSGGGGGRTPGVRLDPMKKDSGPITAHPDKDGEKPKAAKGRIKARLDRVASETKK